MKKLLVYIAVVSCSSCTVVEKAPANSVIVTMGAMDNFYASHQYVINRQENPLVYKTNGQCQRGQALQDCMWWGINFQYPQLEQDVMLNCTTIKVTDTEAGHPQGLITPTQVSYQWNAKLPAGSISRTLAFFSVPGKGEERLATRCVVQGMNPVEFSLVIKWREEV